MKEDLKKQAKEIADKAINNWIKDANVLAISIATMMGSALFLKIAFSFAFIDKDWEVWIILGMSIFAAIVVGKYLMHLKRKWWDCYDQKLERLENISSTVDQT